MNPKGFPIGVDGGELFTNRLEEQHLILKKDEVVILFTDGINEAMNSSRQEFGESRLAASVKKNRLLRAQEIATKIQTDVESFVRDQPQSDDFSVVTLKSL